MQCQSVDKNIKQLGQQAAFILTLCNQEPSRIHKIAPRVQNNKQIAIVDTQSLGCGQKCKLQMSTIARGERLIKAVQDVTHIPWEVAAVLNKRNNH